MKGYKLAGDKYPIQRMPMRKHWMAIEPNVYLTLFAWLAPLKEGRAALQEFAAKAETKYAQPTYLAYIVLNPVLKIVKHIMDICMIAGVITNAMKGNSMTYHKIRHQTTAYIARQYLTALVYSSGETEEAKDNKAIGGTEIAKLTGVTKILLNLPREYQRWNKYYGQQGKSIQPRKTKTDAAATSPRKNKPAGKSPEKRDKAAERPFDVTCKIHDSFKHCTYKARKKGNLADHVRLELGPKWDPLIVTKGLLENKYDIDVDDMNNDAVESYTGGKLLVRAARGNTADSKPRKNDQEASDDNATTQTQNLAQKTQTEVDELICNGAKKCLKATTRKQKEMVIFCNELSKDFTEYITKMRPQDDTIHVDDLKNDGNNQSKKKTRTNAEQQMDVNMQTKKKAKTNPVQEN